MPQQLFRVISWNLAGASHPGAAGKEDQRKAWELLCELDPDLVLLQEVKTRGIPSWDTEGWTIHQGVVGRYVKAYHWGSVIAARDDLQLQENDAVFADRGLQILYDYILAGQVRLQGVRDLFVASIHTPARPFEDHVKLGAFGYEGLPGLDELRRPGYADGKPYLNDLAFRCLQRYAVGRRFIIGGDWNTSRCFGDEGAAFFRRAEADGWTECHWAANRREAQTYFGNTVRRCQLDHLFCDKQTGASLVDCRVLDEPWALELSDHAPLMAEFSLAPGPEEGVSMAAPQRRAYEELRTAIEDRGGTMTYEQAGHPKGGAWIVTLGGKTGTFLSDGNGFPELDMLYIPKRGLRPTHHSHYTQTFWKNAIDQLVSMLS